MSKLVCFGDQIYIEISNLQPPPNTEKRFLCSMGFLNQTVYGVKSNDYHHANFRNCIFKIIPSLVDSKEDSQTVSSLKTELSLLSTNRSESNAQKYLSNEIELKEKQIEKAKSNIDSLNKKIINETDGKEVSFGEIVLLQHLESGYYLCAESSHHPNNPSLHNLKLQEERTPKCYFKFFSYLSPSDRTFIDYQSEMKLISTHLNTVVTLGEIKTKIDHIDSTTSYDEPRNLEKPMFPDDEIRRNNILNSFGTGPFAVGTILESPLNHRIRLVEYCSKENLANFKKKRIFKNGDYVRLNIDDFYLKAAFHKDTENKDSPSLNLVEQKSEGYKYHFLNSIFQIVRLDHENLLPLGTEIHSLQKKFNAEENLEKFCIKHFATDSYLSIPQEKLCSEEGEHNDHPYFTFVHDNSTPQNPLTRNSRVSLKIFTPENTNGTFYLESKVENFEMSQYDLLSKGYVGFKNPAEKPKHKLKAISKTIVANPNVGSFFQLSIVHDEEMRKMLEFETYVNAFKHFMRVLQGAIKKNPEITVGVFKNELSKILSFSEQLKNRTASINPQIQHIVREFRILDIISRFFHYFLVSHDIAKEVEEIKFEMEEIVELIENFGAILVNCTKNNEISYLYVSQYIRTFIQCLLNPSSFFTYCNRKQTEKVKDCLVVLLYNFLGERDLDTFGQFVYVEKELFRNLDAQDDFSTHLLQVMNHYFKSECPNLDNRLRANFIKSYVGDPARIMKIFPQIKIVREPGKAIDFEIQIEREFYPSTMLLSKVGTEVQNYLIWVFKLIAATSKARSLQFSHIIMKYYPEDICENLLTAPELPAKLKNSILSMLKAVHGTYDRLPFDRISTKIQMLLSKEMTEKWQIIFGTRIRDAENTLLSQEELDIVRNDDRDIRAKPTTSRMSIYKLSVDIIKEGTDQMNKGELETLPFVLQVAKNVLDEEELTEESLCLIHHFLAGIINKVAIELTDKEVKRKYYDFFLKNSETIFSILSRIDECVVSFAFKESLEKVKEKLFKSQMQSLATETPRTKLISESPVIEGAALHSLTGPLLDPWKSKEKLYQRAGRSLEGAFLEDKLRKSLWTIIENTSGELTHDIICLIKNKVDFEENVNRQLSECALIAEENEIYLFDDLVTSLLNLNRFKRKLHLITEFELEKKENEKTLDEILNNIETIFLCIYDYETHMREEDKTLTKEKAKEILLHRFMYSKVRSANELPFRYKGHCIKTYYQKIMKTLNAHEILIPFLKYFSSKGAFEEVDAGKLKLGNCLIMAIAMLFMYNNPANQNIMSLYPPFILVFYTDDILDSSVEAVYMFTEMCKGNQKLLKLNRDYLFSVAIHDLVDYYKKITKETDKPITLNYIRSLPVILTSKIPQDLFDPARFMMDTFFEFCELMNQNNQLSLLRRIQQLENNGNALFEIVTQVKETGMYSENQRMIDMPIFYSMIKELLESEKLFALTEDKERVLVLQSRFTLEKITPFITNENIMFNFELKHLTIETLENIFFKNVYKNVNIFTDYDHFRSFTALLFVDAYAYLKKILPENDKFLSLFENEYYFGSEECVMAMDKYNQLLQFNVDRIGFLEYQSIILLKQTWRKYIYYIMCDFFVHFIFNFKDYMLNTKDSQSSSISIFELWLRIVLQLRLSDQNDRSSSARLDNALKSAVIHTEYAHCREMVSSALDIPNKMRVMSRTTIAKDVTPNEEVNSVLEKFIKDQSEVRIEKVESNTKKIILDLGGNRSILKLLIDMLYLPEIHTKDVLFILKLLRKSIEAENKSEKDEFKPIYLWGDVSELEMQNIRNNQETLVDLGLVKAIFALFYDYPKDRTILKEILVLCIAMLYGGNKVVQDAFYAEFIEDSDNEILTSFTQIFEDILEVFRMKETHKTHQSYLDSLKFIYSFLSDDKKSLVDVVENRVLLPEASKGKLAAAYHEFQEKEKEFKKDETEYHQVDSEILLIILEFFQTLCEGHHFNFQEFLRDQTVLGHSKNSNVPEILTQAYSIYHKYINVDNVETGVKILDMLTEIQQGASEANIELLLKKTFISDLCNTLIGFNNDLDLLARGFEFNSSHKRFVEIKAKVLIILKDLVERSDQTSLKKLIQFIDLQALTSTFRDNIIAFHEKKNKILLNNKNFEIDDMWDANLSSAFTINFILKHLSFEMPNGEFSNEIKDAFSESISEKKIHEATVNYYRDQFFSKNTGAIEIFQGRSNKLLKIYFPIPPMYAFLKEETKEEFAERVDRTNTMTKITNLIDTSREIIGQMYIEYYSRKRLFGINFTNAFTSIRLLTNIISIGVVFNDMFGLTYGDEGAEYESDAVNQANDILSIIQACLAGVLILLWFQTKLGRFLAFKWDEFCDNNVKEEGAISNDILQKVYDREEITPQMAEAVLRLKGPYSDEWGLIEGNMKHRELFYNVYFTFHSGALLWHIVYLGICIGSIFHPLASAFQLFDIIVRSDTVSRIVRSVSRNVRQFGWTLILLLVTVYVYTLIGFHFLHERYQDDDGDFCPDAYSCYIANINFGLRNGGGIADSLQNVKYQKAEKGYYLGTALFDLSFFILMITLLLNLIFGMIIDAFGDLRDEKTSNDEDMANTCFICGLERSEFERYGRFEDHIYGEHNMWQYIAYLIYLNEKGKLYSTDFTDIEDYVSDRNKKKDLIWIPVGRSLTLERQLAKLENDRKSDIEKLRDDMETYFKTIMEQNQHLAQKVEALSAAAEEKATVTKPRSFKQKKSNKV